MLATSDIGKKYNELVGREYHGDYEKQRWLSSRIQRAMYAMAKSAIERHTRGIRCDLYFELGPGPGTWTRLFLQRFPQAHFDLVDISEEMRRAAAETLGNVLNVRYTVSDFMQYRPERQYDFFFSSRALEYFPDKKKTIKRIANLLKSGGIGFIITKTPHYHRVKLLRKEISNFHSGQIAPPELNSLLRENGCEVLGMYPVTMSLPVFRSALLNRLVFLLLASFRLHWLSQFLSESYCVKFKKP